MIMQVKKSYVRIHMYGMEARGLLSTWMSLASSSAGLLVINKGNFRNLQVERLSKINLIDNIR